MNLWRKYENSVLSLGRPFGRPIVLTGKEGEKERRKCLTGPANVRYTCQRKGNEVLPWRKPEPLVRQIMS